MQQLSFPVPSVTDEAEAVLTQWRQVVLFHGMLSSAERTVLRQRMLMVGAQLNVARGCRIKFMSTAIEVRVGPPDSMSGINEVIEAAIDAVGARFNVRIR